jgi:hypothetical protein
MEEEDAWEFWLCIYVQRAAAATLVGLYGYAIFFC